LAKKKQTENKTALVLRCCAADMRSSHGFVWPGVGKVAEAPDWEANGACGKGLHGWLYGQGDHSCCDYWSRENSKWLVLEVEESAIHMLGGKCKFPRATVRFVGSMADAAAYLIEHEPRAATVAVIGANLRADDGQPATVGALGTATAGSLGTATAGDRGTATAGDRGEIRVRYWDEKNSRYRTVIGYVGEGGIEANVAYRLDAKLQLVKA
jgi:hypothetical protein